LFGRTFKVEIANIAEALAAAAVLEMGEGNQQTPIAVLRGVRNINFSKKRVKEAFFVKPEEDLYSLFWKKANWKRGGGNRKRGKK
jgi:F420-0:gamma-glutamyl ligase